MDSWFTPLARWALAFLEPLTLLWLGLLVLALVLARRRLWGFAVGAGAAFGWVTVLGCTAAPVWFVGTLERRYAYIRAERQPAADVILLLGGGVSPSPLEVGRVHLTIAGDRLPAALELVRLGKAPVLCVSGGLPRPHSPHLVEADLVAKAIADRGLAAGAEVISLGGCLDTHDEAVHLRRLADARGWKRVLLVTSAAHMRRAEATFRAEGFEAIPAPCNFLTGTADLASPLAVGLPSPNGFTFFSVAMHERIGWFEYRRRGWIRE